MQINVTRRGRWQRRGGSSGGSGRSSGTIHSVQRGAYSVVAYCSERSHRHCTSSAMPRSVPELHDLPDELLGAALSFLSVSEG